MESSTIAIIITVVSMILFFSNKLPMSVVGSITALAIPLEPLTSDIIFTR